MSFLLIFIVCNSVLFLVRQFAKKTLFKTAAKAGFKQKPESRKHKYSLPTIQSKSMTTPGPGRTLSAVQNLGPDVAHSGRPMSFFEDDASSKRIIFSRYKSRGGPEYDRWMLKSVNRQHLFEFEWTELRIVAYHSFFFF